MIVFTLFIIINALICISDIRKRRIPNPQLFFLIILLPFWINIGYTITWDKFLIIIILNILLLTYGIISFEKVSSFGGGDIKYAGIILFYLGDSKISLFMWNIGVLTIIALILWLLYLLMVIVRSRIFLSGEKIKLKGFFTQYIKGWEFLIIDWFFVGFGISIGTLYLLMIILPLFGQKIGTDHYFTIMILIIVLRPLLRKIYTTRYGFYFISSIGLFLIWYAVDVSLIVFLREYMVYLKNIILFGSIFILTDIISKAIFTYYQIYLERRRKYENDTLPFSVIIFIGYIFTFFLDTAIVGNPF